MSDEQFLRGLLQARKRVPILRIIPVQCRLAVALAFSQVLKNVLEKNDRESWHRLLSFSICTLRVPKKEQRTKKKLASAVAENLKDFKNGRTIFNILELYPEVGERPKNKNDNMRQASKKLSEGDVRAAVRHLSSTDTIAPASEETMKILREKHPVAPEDIDLPEKPRDDHPCEIRVSVKEVRDAIFSFPVASSGGFDGLRPRHLRDMLTAAAGDEAPLLQGLVELCSMVIRGQLPDFILPMFYGASLTAFLKKSGGIRPIACGLTLRRLACKIAVRSKARALTSLFLPEQVGCGVRNGCEAGRSPDLCPDLCGEQQRLHEGYG